MLDGVKGHHNAMISVFKRMAHSIAQCKSDRMEDSGYDSDISTDSYDFRSRLMTGLTLNIGDTVLPYCEMNGDTCADSSPKKRRKTAPFS